jgi:hypothetical protein
MIGSNAAITVAFFGAVASVAWSATVAWIYWLRHRFDELEANRPQTVEYDRIARLEATVDGLAVEMERLGEAQRLTVKLLDERLPLQSSIKPLPSGVPGRVITPH